MKIVPVIYLGKTFSSIISLDAHLSMIIEIVMSLIFTFTLGAVLLAVPLSVYRYSSQLKLFFWQGSDDVT